ncbi:hypothetical protein V3C99_007336 [Haemonchus contortus]|nr:unnamed protein product [Haemonchus contortus]
MLPYRVLVSPLLWFIFLYQVYPALFCTFKSTTDENVSWDDIYVHRFIHTQSHIGCLEKCLNEFPQCVMVGVKAEDFEYHCYIYTLRSSPIHIPWYPDPSIVHYKLEREEVDVQCPLAVDVLT